MTVNQAKKQVKKEQNNVYTASGLSNTVVMLGEIKASAGSNTKSQFVQPNIARGACPGKPE